MCINNKKALLRAFAILGLLILVALVAPPAVIAAEKPLSVKKMTISIQPEYDDPRVMVTYQGEFKDGSVFPQDVKFPVPLGSEINMVCALKPPADEHLCQLYDTLTNPEGLDISYTLPIPTYYLEYYWDGIKGLPDKSFTFKYVSPFAVDSLEVEVVQPLKSTDFKLAPAYASVNADTRGMKYYHYQFNNVTAGQVISLDVSYNKADNKPSVAKQPGAGSSNGASGKDNSNAYTIMGIGGILLAAVAVGFVLLRRKPARAEARQMNAQRMRPQNVPRPAQPAPARTPPSAAASRPQGGGAAFCTQCGAKLAAGAAFCHACGARTKGSS